MSLFPLSIAPSAPMPPQASHPCPTGEAKSSRWHLSRLDPVPGGVLIVLIGITALESFGPQAVHHPDDSSWTYPHHRGWTSEAGQWKSFLCQRAIQPRQMAADGACTWLGFHTSGGPGAVPDPDSDARLSDARLSLGGGVQEVASYPLASHCYSAVQPFRTWNYAEHGIRQIALGIIHNVAELATEGHHVNVASPE